MIQQIVEGATVIDFVHKNLRHAELQARKYKKMLTIRTNSLKWCDIHKVWLSQWEIIENNLRRMLPVSYSSAYMEL